MTADQQRAHDQAIQILAQLGVPTFLNAREKALQAACEQYQKLGPDGFQALFDQFVANVKVYVDPPTTG